MILVDKIQKYIFLFICSLLLSGCFFSPKVVTINGETMGTYYRVVISEDLSKQQLTSTRRDIDELLNQVNLAMSTYIASSELSKLNQASQGFFPLSEETLKVFKSAYQISEKTDGAYDITAGPLVNLWGFGPTGQRRVPTHQQIEEKLESIGYKKSPLKTNGVVKFKATTYFDLSSIAKGYGVDQVSRLLIGRGLKNHLVEIGGEVYVSGRKSQDSLWKIGIETPHPKNSADRINKVLKLQDMALATSGNYRNFFKNKGKMYSHTIDPRTGHPVEHSLLSVSVIMKNCMIADAWATALMVLGPEEGFKLAERLSIPAHFIFKTQSGIKVSYTNAMKRFE